MVNAERSSDLFHGPHRLPNRIAGFIFLGFFAPVILVVAAALLARSDDGGIFVTRHRPDLGGAAPLWQFRIADEDTALDNFLQRSRLNLLPQLINVARGDIAIYDALQ
jgi:lipopolysaccharide/colanic/teichoic acid biosynthesis glycosyltransferase